MTINIATQITLKQLFDYRWLIKIDYDYIEPLADQKCEINHQIYKTYYTENASEDNSGLSAVLKPLSLNGLNSGKGSGVSSFALLVSLHYTPDRAEVPY